MDPAKIVMREVQSQRRFQICPTFLEKASISRVSRLRHWRSVPFLRSTCSRAVKIGISPYGIPLYGDELGRLVILRNRYYRACVLARPYAGRNIRLFTSVPLTP
jgi:hypothetical protein